MSEFTDEELAQIEKERKEYELAEIESAKSEEFNRSANK